MPTNPLFSAWECLMLGFIAGAVLIFLTRHFPKSKPEEKPIYRRVISRSPEVPEYYHAGLECGHSISVHLARSAMMRCEACKEEYDVVKP